MGMPVTADQAARQSGAAHCEVTSAHCRVFRVPTDQPEADGTLKWNATTVVVVEVAAAGSVGLGWTYASAGCQAVIEQELTHAVLGVSALDIPCAHEAMVRACRNLGRPGIVGTAISAVDIALWDLKARLLGLALVDLFGRCREDVPVYGSGGFTTYDDGTMSAQLEGWVHQCGIPRVKIKIGESWGTAVERDLSRVACCRQVVGDAVEIYVDANGGYQTKQAVRVGKRLFGDHDVIWFEEPVSSDDLAGLRQVRSQLEIDVAAGEYGYDETYYDHMVRAEAVDCLQADVTRCGGYTSWLRVAGLAGAHGLQISGHCAPNLHAHVAASVPNLRHIEYFHDHSRVDSILFDGVSAPLGGSLHPDPGCAGHGMVLRESDARKLQVG
jgi:L-alanine-DL-glutamate epimerase-like enolase superfamily enzyme